MKPNTPEENAYWYDEEQKCAKRKFPDNRYDDLRWVKEVDYDIHEVGDWVVYKRAYDQAASWNEEHFRDTTWIVVKCSRTFFILDINEYTKLIDKMVKDAIL